MKACLIDACEPGGASRSRSRRTRVMRSGGGRQKIFAVKERGGLSQGNQEGDRERLSGNVSRGPSVFAIKSRRVEMYISVLWMGDPGEGEIPAVL